MSIEKNPWTESYWSITAQAKFIEQHGTQKAREAILEAGLNPDHSVQKDQVIINKFGRATIARGEAYIPAPLDDAPPPPSLLGAFSKEAGETFEKNLDKPPEATEEQKAQASFTRAVCAAQNKRNLEARKRVNSPGWKSGRLPE